MITLSVSKARNELPTLLKTVCAENSEVILTRHGKPIASIVPYGRRKTKSTRYPLRGLPIKLSDDFDAPMPELWKALQ